MNLTEFLLARIAEDEARAGAAFRDVIDKNGHCHAAWTAVGDAVMADTKDDYVWIVEQHERIGDMDVARHVAHWDPARVFAECEAKRRLIEFTSAVIANEALDYSDPLLRLMGLPYSDHPDYDEAWRS